MWLVLALASTGCMVGGGPVLAVRNTGKFAVGWDASSTVINVGVETGGTYGFGAPNLGYFALRAALAIAPDTDFTGNYQLGIGTTLGYARAEDRGGGIAAIWTQYVRGDLSSCTATPMFMLQLGLRQAARQIEYFISPQVYRYTDVCFD